jgi:hypothetical protein
MAVKIKEISTDRYSVNGKLVHKDMDGKWIAHSEMTINEVSFFQKHLLKLEGKK